MQPWSSKYFSTERNCSSVRSMPSSWATSGARGTISRTLEPFACARFAAPKTSHASAVGSSATASLAAEEPSPEPLATLGLPLSLTGLGLKRGTLLLQLLRPLLLLHSCLQGSLGLLGELPFNPFHLAALLFKLRPQSRLELLLFARLLGELA